MYIFQEMVDTEREYVKSLQYIMDVSKLLITFVVVHCVLFLFLSCVTSTVFVYYRITL